MSFNQDAFMKELQSLINRHCGENESNTPDFIIAGFLRVCMAALASAIVERDRWYGINPSPGAPHE